MRLLRSGPRSGSGELILPREQPDRRHARPGEPDAAEATDHGVCARDGEWTRHGGFASQGHFELNVYNPMMSYNVLPIHAAFGADSASALPTTWFVGTQSKYRNVSTADERKLML